MGDTNSLQRFPVSPQDASQYRFRRNGSYMIHCVVTAQGRFDPIRMERALQRVCAAVPVLSSRYVCEDGVPVWWERLEELPPLVSSTSLSADAAALLPYDMEGHPPVRAVVCRGTDHDGLVVSVDHVATDARGMFVLMELLAETYSRLRTNPSYTPEIIPQPEDRSFSALFSQVPGNRLSGIVREAEDPVRPYLPWNNPFAGSMGEEFGILRRCVDAGTFRHLRNWGRDHDATIQDVLIGCFARTLFDLGAAGTLPVLSVADMRRYFGEEAAGWILNLSANYWVPVPEMPDADLPELIGAVSAYTARWKSSWPGVAGAAFSLDASFRQHHHITLLTDDPSLNLGVPFLSNVGVIPRRAGNFGEGVRVSDLYVFANYMRDSCPAVMAGTWNGTLSLVSPETHVSGRILDTLVYHLGELL